MKFGKRRWEAKLESKVDDTTATSSDESVPEGWSVRADPEPEQPTSVVPPTKVDESVEPAVDGEAIELPPTEVLPDEAPSEPEREFDYSAPVAAVEPEPEPEPVAEPEPEPVAEPELEPAPAATPSFFRPPVAEPPPPPPPPPTRAAGEPLPPPGVSWAPTPPPMPSPVVEEPVLVYSSGPGSDPTAVTPLADAGEAHAPGMSPSWPEPVMQLASERPEALVGAAFAGGALLALILRRLGN